MSLFIYRQTWQYFTPLTCQVPCSSMLVADSPRATSFPLSFFSPHQDFQMKPHGGHEIPHEEGMQDL